jgi:hypothetical protein
MAEGLTDRGRPIFGPTPPGQGPPGARQSPLTGAEVAFRLAHDFPVRAEPYTEADARAGIDCPLGVVEASFA